MDNKIIISKSKLIKSLNFSESNRLILGTSGEGQPIHWKREMIMDEYANIGAAKISDNDKWIVINSDSNELTFVPKDKNDTELVICKNVCLKKDGEDTHVLLIFQKSGELLSKARKYIKSNKIRVFSLLILFIIFSKFYVFIKCHFSINYSSIIFNIYYSVCYSLNKFMVMGCK